MKNPANSYPPALIAIFSVIIIVSILTIEIVNARPVENPTAGNPTVNVQGSTGPTGTPGSTGAQGATGARGATGIHECRLRSASCYSPSLNGCYTSTLYNTNGYDMTGGWCGSPNDLQVFSNNITSSSIRCYCHDKQIATNGYCYAFLWECRT